jgi:nucleoid DNA-binding protein
MATEKKQMNKSQLAAVLADSTELSKAQVNSVLASLGSIAQKELGKKGPGVFVLPGIVKLSVTKKPATKAREGVNPFTGEKIMIAAKPARNVVKARVLKQLKDAV